MCVTFSQYDVRVRCFFLISIQNTSLSFSDLYINKDNNGDEPCKQIYRKGGGRGPRTICCPFKAGPEVRDDVSNYGT